MKTVQRRRKRTPQRRRHFLTQWRQYRALTQAQVTERLNWPQSKLSRMEANTINITVDDLDALADVYACRPADLLNVDPSESDDHFDMLKILDSADEAERREIANFARFLTQHKRAG